jgi:hypothetical protein
MVGAFITVEVLEQLQKLLEAKLKDQALSFSQTVIF